MLQVVGGRAVGIGSLHHPDLQCTRTPGECSEAARSWGHFMGAERAAGARLEALHCHGRFFRVKLKLGEKYKL